MKKTPKEILISYVDALYPIIYFDNVDLETVDKLIKDIRSKETKIYEYNNAFGLINFYNKVPNMINLDTNTLEGTLKYVYDLDYENNFLILRDIDNNELHNSKIIALLKRISEKTMNNENYNTTIFLICSKLDIPIELENYTTVFDLPLPTFDDIVKIITEYCEKQGIKISEDVLNNFARSLKGLNEFQIIKILNLAYQDGGYINESDRELILKEKEQLIKKSNLLEIMPLKESIENIGGLDNLKEWLNSKAKILSNLDKAIKFGVDIPKGVLIVGMPGCGKSLAAKATANLFKVPLVRLDIGRLLGKYVGESEHNMQKALKLSEAISPCVLWIDEIEKVFSGIGNNMGNETTTRLFGNFLTWLQEKENTVFIVATANDINMPPEFLRKGRFDEIFFVDLPNEDERRNIFKIHLNKRIDLNKNRDIDINFLLKKTKGYNGADIESVVKESIEKAFINNQKSITTDLLVEVINNTKSISDTLKEKITKISEKFKTLDIKKASK